MKLLSIIVIVLGLALLSSGTYQRFNQTNKIMNEEINRPPEAYRLEEEKNVVGPAYGKIIGGVLMFLGGIVLFPKRKSEEN